MDQEVIFVGLDVHKATIAVALAPDGRSNEVRFQGSVPHRPGAMADLGRRLQSKGRVPGGGWRAVAEPLATRAFHMAP